MCTAFYIVKNGITIFRWSERHVNSNATVLSCGHSGIVNYPFVAKYTGELFVGTCVACMCWREHEPHVVKICYATINPSSHTDDGHQWVWRPVDYKDLWAKNKHRRLRASSKIMSPRELLYTRWQPRVSLLPPPRPALPSLPSPDNELHAPSARQFHNFGLKYHVLIGGKNRL